MMCSKLYLILYVCVLACVTHGILFSSPSRVCFGDLGCFDNKPPFRSLQRLITFLPLGPKYLQTKFLLYTRSNPTSADEEELTLNSIGRSHFNPHKKTKIVVHGWTHNAHRQWVQDIVSELLHHEDMNVIAVDWKRGAGMVYGQATANTRVVGAQIGQLINILINSTGTTPDKFHVIGHSLGAHVAGYAGERVKNMARITGLDPAAPYYEGTDPRVRLDPSDALFVDALHSDSSGILSLGLGIRQAVGHVDFYPNNGQEQPGCDQNLLSKLTHTVLNAATMGYLGAEAAVACSHMRSVYLFKESINSPCPFQAYPCTSAQKFSQGKCLQCLGNQCSRMGYHADKYQGRGSLYLKTESSSPYCHYHYEVNISSNSNMNGIVKIVLHGQTEDTATKQLTTSDTVINTHNTLSRLITSQKDLSDVTGITVSYDETNNLLISWMFPDDWKLMGISVLEGETQKTTRFCAYGKDVQSNSHSYFPVTGHCS